MSHKLKHRKKQDNYKETIIDKICGDNKGSKTNKLLVEKFFKDAAFRAIFNFFVPDLIENGYTPNANRAPDLPGRVPDSDEMKVEEYREVVRNYKAFSDMLGKVMERYPD